MYFCHIEYFAYGEINERSFSNPHPWTDTDPAGLLFTEKTPSYWNKDSRYKHEMVVKPS